MRRSGRNNHHKPSHYPHFKEWCDEHFHPPHRGKPCNIGETFLDICPKPVHRHMNEPWAAAEREHQLVRRGHYIEFNLLHDRGIKFGLMTGGNVEAILMSLPSEACWP